LNLAICCTQLTVKAVQTEVGSCIVRLRGTRERADLFRLRIGDYRAIYAIEDQAVYVTELFHRGRGHD
jgi:mRNA-degrading endonuclease RelE of RelBE toxin-antitoxin system